MAGIAVTTTINGDTVEYLCQPDETLLDNIRRYERGEPLLNVVDRARGY